MPVDVEFPDGLRPVPSRRFGMIRDGRPVMIEQPIEDRDWRFEEVGGRWRAVPRSGALPPR